MKLMSSYILNVKKMSDQEKKDGKNNNLTYIADNYNL